ncbi:hypothetical protein Tco_0655549 [Tanacetum coccineum]|uniref:Uncharacterized protein n=1 Tax=Tanacetum coccineum TaxID=301880 RepID=A0ABQ4X6B7_9ASTR
MVVKKETTVYCHQCHHYHPQSEVITCSGRCVLKYGLKCLARKYKETVPHRISIAHTLDLSAIAESSFDLLTVESSAVTEQKRAERRPTLKSFDAEQLKKKNKPRTKHSERKSEGQLFAIIRLMLQNMPSRSRSTTLFAFLVQGSSLLFLASAAYDWVNVRTLEASVIKPLIGGKCLQWQMSVKRGTLTLFHSYNVMAYDNAVSAVGKLFHFHRDSIDSAQVRKRRKGLFRAPTINNLLPTKLFLFFVGGDLASDQSQSANSIFCRQYSTRHTTTPTLAVKRLSAPAAPSNEVSIEQSISCHPNTQTR